MSDSENNKNIIIQFFESISSWIDKDIKEMIGFYIGMYFLITLPIIVFSGVSYLNKFFNTKEVNETKKCWELKGAEGRVYKINLCTGESVELNRKDIKELDKTKKEEEIIPHQQSGL